MYYEFFLFQFCLSGSTVLGPLGDMSPRDHETSRAALKAHQAISHSCCQRILLLPTRGMHSGSGVTMVSSSEQNKTHMILFRSTWGTEVCTVAQGLPVIGCEQNKTHDSLSIHLKYQGIQSGSGITMVGSSDQHKTRDSLSIRLRYWGMHHGIGITHGWFWVAQNTWFSFYPPEVLRYAKWLRDYP